MAPPAPLPLWLDSPSRFAAWRRPAARIGLVLLLLLVAASFLALRVAEPAALGAEAATSAPSEQTDLALYEKIVSAVKGGDNYYTAAADALRAGSYPLRPFLTFRLPALATVLAALPGWAPRYLLWLLAFVTALAWALRLAAALPRLAPRLVTSLLIAGSMLAFIQPGLVAFHEVWAGLLVALSLAIRRPGHWVEAVAIGLAAMLIRETATLYAVVMALAAWREGERREAWGWGAALLLFAAMLGFHAWAVAGVTGPNDPASPGWMGLQGYGLFVKAVTLATALQLLPLAAAAPLVALAMFGWASWRDPLGTRMFGLLTAYALAIGLFARLDTFYWGLMPAPIFLAGLAFVPDGLRDLVRQSLAPGKPRITVTRLAR
ncbi:hypothetical protein [Sphingomonas sp.]|uniref:hypothetical protein n=1 Tax=Sphingomonas sp. TaxID=28214 RepID=UPI001B191EE5|nr:hypothetical protein [Sphingomonas sp.]MBO9711510.1 hypothetical protein [Sphingomonas sp.]